MSDTLKISIFHNLSRDYLRTYAAGQPLCWVFQYEMERGWFPADNYEMILADAFELLNIGGAGEAERYRARRLRSVSVGDVVGITDGKTTSYHAVDSIGFSPVNPRGLRILPARDAEPVIRERYDIPYCEALSITVPLPD